MIPAFGEILRQWDAKVGAWPPLSGTHYGLERLCSANVGMWSAAVGKSAYDRHTHLAGVNMLHEAGSAVIVEQVNNVERYERQSRQKPPQTRILYAPNPGGEIIRQGSVGEVRAEHPVGLYGENDNLTSLATISDFANRNGATLEVMPGGEHWFHTPEQMAFLDGWIFKEIPASIENMRIFASGIAKSHSYGR